MTNRERINQLSNEEFMEVLHIPTCPEKYFHKCCPAGISCRECWAAWLGEEETNGE